MFCRIVAGTLPGQIVYRDERVTAFRDLRPQAPTHVLVVPNEHVESIADLGLDDGELLARLVAASNEVARREGIERDGFRLVVNQGSDAGQSVGHLHLHVLGGRRLRWPPG
jgi:histidine triad (HIT) family protein